MSSPKPGSATTSASSSAPSQHAGIDRLCEKAWALRYNSPAQAVKDAREILKSARKNGYAWGEARSHQIIGACLSLQNDFTDSLEHLQTALDLYQQRNHKESAAETTAHIATTYMMMEQFDVALNWQYKALELSREFQLKQVEANTLYNIGVLYNELGEHEQALKFHQKALAKKKQNGADEFNLITSLSAMGEVYFKSKRYITALEYQQEALAQAKLIGMRYALGITLMRIGEIRMATGDHHEAESALRKAEENFRVEDGHETSIVELQLILCELFARTGRHEQSLEAGRTALEIAKRLGLMRLLARCHNYMSQAYEAAGNYQRALEEMKVFNKIKEQSVQQSARQTFKALQRYQEIERHAHEKEQYKQQTIKLFEANEQMQAQQATLEYTINQFRHSITYASRIQQAMLPPIETIGKHFDDNFVLFMPRDGVSGDFYYLQALDDDSLIVAAADCTGHGVPGALLGMLGYSLLNLIVNERGYRRPDKILKLLDLYIREVLCRQNPGQKMDDGMDISLIHYEPRRRMLQYAGAMNPLYWARHGQVQKVDADRVGIGGTHKGLKKFHLNEIPVERRDCIYLFTDGFHDQFGPGKSRQKKFSPKRMREILADAHDLEMQQQHDYLKSQLIAHQNDLPQTDDILVMGMRI